MPKKDRRQQLAHKFLLEKFGELAPFTLSEFQEATEWDESGTFDTYVSKHYEVLLVPLEGGRYRVSEVFRRFVEWAEFKKLVTQKRSVVPNYSGVTHDWVIMLEFFMPLTNEGYLRSSLDALFYRDAVKRRLKTVRAEELHKRLVKKAGEVDDLYLERVCDWVSTHFGGYSIGHVSGRYRADSLKTFEQAYQIARSHGRYLVDETTAVVRFIIPFGAARTNGFDAESEKSRGATGEIEAERIRFFFRILFLQHILEAVAGEDEIWLLESGFCSRLHKWTKS